jgi:hypothetical protein
MDAILAESKPEDACVAADDTETTAIGYTLQEHGYLTWNPCYFFHRYNIHFECILRSEYYVT